MTVPYIYVASSWRNQHYPRVLEMLRGAGAAAGLPEPRFGVHDFREQDASFSWRDVDAGWEDWDRHRYAELVQHPIATVGFERDMAGLDAATACLLVGPCGRSAHLELGYAVGARKVTAIYLPEDQEPELMYRMAGRIITDPTALMNWAMDYIAHASEMAT